MGGDSAKDQLRSLQGGVEIVTGTPGRLDDLISTGKLDLSAVSTCVCVCACVCVCVCGHGCLHTCDTLFSADTFLYSGRSCEFVCCSCDLLRYHVTSGWTVESRPRRSH